LLVPLLVLRLLLRPRLRHLNLLLLVLFLVVVLLLRLALKLLNLVVLVALLVLELLLRILCRGAPRNTARSEQGVAATCKH
jgi:hypothetical protein